MEPGEAHLLKVRVPVVVSETVAGETIIMHHETGHYFDTSGTGSLLWDALVTGATIDELASLLGARTGADAAIAREAARDFVLTLLNHDLVAPAMDAIREGRSDPPGTDDAAPLEFAIPVLGVHTDMADLLLLDPIHDVGEAGWPTQPQLETT